MDKTMRDTMERKNERYKRGNVFISLGIIIIIIIFIAIVLTYYQLNIIIENLRYDLFYAANSAILSFDAQDLTYNKYTIYEEKTKTIIKSILNKNYVENKGSVKNIEITNLKITSNNDNVNIQIEIEVTFDSVINIASSKQHKFKIKEQIKISLLDYVGRE